MADNNSQTKTAEIGEVPAHWEVVPLNSFTTRVTYGFTNPMPTTDTGPFKLTAKDIHNGRIDYATARRTSWDAYHEDLTEKSRPSIGDVLLTKDGSIGRVAICDRSDICINQSVAVLQPKNNIDSRFLKFLLETPHYQRRMANDADGTTIKHIYITRVDKMQVAVPPLNEQKAIARILGALDDKIELNRRMNETLEAMARAIFKSWFVDFDPVRAKLDGRQPPGMDAETAALFPDRFEHTELGLVPKGWKIGRLDDLLVLQRGFDLPTKNRTPGPVAVFSAGGHHGMHVEAKVSGPGVVTGRSGVLGSVYYVHDDFWPLNTTLWVKEFRSSRPLHAYHLLRTLGLEGFNSGSAVPTLNRNHIHGLPLIVPPLQVVERYEELFEPLFKQSRHNDGEAASLAETRDALLPKLLSGEIRVSDAETIVGEVV